MRGVFGNVAEIACSGVSMSAGAHEMHCSGVSMSAEAHEMHCSGVSMSAEAHEKAGDPLAGLELCVPGVDGEAEDETAGCISFVATLIDTPQSSQQRPRKHFTAGLLAQHPPRQRLGNQESLVVE